MDPGAYLLFVRATDARGFIGQSSSILVSVGVKSAPAADAASEVPAEDGGEPSFIPVVEPPVAAEDAPDDGSIPEARIPVPPAPGAGAIRGPIPYRPLIGILCRVLPAACDDSSSDLSPRPDPELCMFLTGTTDCSTPSRSGFLPPVAPRISATYAGSCEINVAWADESDDELGFKLYRVSAAPEGALIGVSGAGGTGATDHPGSGGAFRYYVSAFNSQGESPSAPSAEVLVPVIDCATIGGESTYLDLEALTFTVEESLDRVYCYYSIGSAPFVRVPEDEAEFLEPIEGGWNIAVHAGGASRLSIPHDRSAALQVASQCLGWRGVELLDLGGFSQAHPPEEWDGRTLASVGGQFIVTYRILPASLERREGEPSAIIDPSIPPPYNLDYGLLSDCSSRGSAGGGCGLEDEVGLQWDWDPPEGISADWVTYKVFFRIPGAYEEGMPAGTFGMMSGAGPIRQQYYTTTERRAPPAHGHHEACIVNLRNAVGDYASLQPEDLIVAEHISYSVQVQLPSPAGGFIESPMSEEREITLSGCPQILAVTVDSLGFIAGAAAERHSIAGGCDPADVYGHIAIGETRLTWNCPYCEDMARYAAPSPPYQSGRPSHNTLLGCDFLDYVRFSNEPLDRSSPDRGSTGFAFANNVVLVPIESESEPLDVRFWFNNYDSGFHGDDNLWCSGGDVYEYNWAETGRLAVVQTRHDNAQSPNCQLYLSLQVLETR